MADRRIGSTYSVGEGVEGLRKVKYAESHKFLILSI
jgi:hypothetical protein